jgi:hypothetical protein
MEEVLSTFWRELIERPEGPMAFRFYLQPLMALALAIHDGMKDARAGRPAYLFSLATDREHRRERLRDGWRSIGRVFVLAIVLDTIYQIAVLHALHPLQAVVIAIVLAIIPYVLVRGPACRIAAHLMHRPRHAR